MEITGVRIRTVASTGRVKAFGSVVFDDMFAVHGLRVIEGDKGLFVAMPSRKTPSGDYQDVFHPINPEGRQRLSEAVLAKFAAVTAGGAGREAEEGA